MKIYFEEKIIEVNNFNFCESLKVEDEFLYLKCIDEQTLKLVLDHFFANKLGKRLYLNTEVERFKGYFNVIKAAGGVVTNNESILFIYRKNKWDLPKGKVEKEETLREAALREVEEECGISDLKLLSYNSTSYHAYFENGGLVLKETYWYNMSSEQKDNLKPQTEEGIADIKWIKREDAKAILDKSYPLIQEIISDQL